MRTYLPDRIRLRHMETACRQNCEHLRIIDRQILKQAERLTINDRPKVRQYGRHATTWTPADERHYQTCVDAVFETRRTEIDALRRKIDRQRTAIELLRLRLRINEPSPEFDIIMISG